MLQLFTIQSKVQTLKMLIICKTTSRLIWFLNSFLFKGPITLSDSEKGQRTMRKDQSVSSKTSKKMLIFAIAQRKQTLKAH